MQVAKDLQQISNQLQTLQYSEIKVHVNAYKFVIRAENNNMSKIYSL